MNQWSQLANWSWRLRFSLGISSFSSKLLVSLLVEKAIDSSHPMLSQMGAL